ncbi:MAG: Stp1/IreP family PP2C-type Ser/Thr phosphatase [Deltaproteobacteria bacterium]|nr:Stp1/IreP family PP2C-type Ser/Thr phosphatase [Deltaproteobacteria bacterium]MBW2010695.1 Stp1/IreP family PP2C-type Ser/Thr phosphatase [Deltaproteobacteria bacterium]MBW2100732.1 Stp1/IreP family PP2C-type Ser/Thr phosphatase [Deltaproteobacteria bacterium]
MDKINFSGKSDIGLKRNNNEDVFVVKSDLDFCLVADGMGGAAAGEVASHIFAETALEIFLNSRGRSEKQNLEQVQKTFRFANKRILDHVKENPHHEGMGCTAELMAFTHKEFVLGHMGDSRTYRLRNGQLKQLTQDHSLVQEQIDQGLISPAEARNHPLRNIILRAVGINESPALDVIRGKALSGDLFLLCSDGLTDMVDDFLIREVVSSIGTLSQKVEKLIELANAAGGKDNITIVLLEVT